LDGSRLTLAGSDPGTAYRPRNFSEEGSTRTFTLISEATVPDDSQEKSTHSDSDDHVEVYVNCFIQTLYK
jgi:hypothetical protein